MVFEIITMAVIAISYLCYFKIKTSSFVFVVVTIITDIVLHFIAFICFKYFDKKDKKN